MKEEVELAIQTEEEKRAFIKAQKIIDELDGRSFNFGDIDKDIMDEIREALANIIKE